MSSASQQFNATSGATYEHTDYNGEIGNLITHINNIYSFIDDNTGTSPLTVDTGNNRLGINITAPLSELHVADAAGSVEGRFDSTITGTTYGLYIGADSNEPYIGARTNHGLRVVTNSLLTAYFETTKKLRLYSEGSVTDYAHVYSSTANDLVLSPFANGDVVGIGRMPRDNNGSATYALSHIQRGWGYMTGDGSTSLSDGIVLPVAYSSTAWILSVSVCGLETGASAPTSEGGFSSGAPSGIYASYYVVNSSQATVSLNKTTGTFTSGDFYGYSWIAIGPV